MKLKKLLLSLSAFSVLATYVTITAVSPEHLKEIEEYLEKVKDNYNEDGWQLKDMIPSGSKSKFFFLQKISDKEIMINECIKKNHPKRGGSNDRCNIFKRHQDTPNSQPTIKEVLSDYEYSGNETLGSMSWVISKDIHKLENENNDIDLMLAQKKEELQTIENLEEKEALQLQINVFEQNKDALKEENNKKLKLLKNRLSHVEEVQKLYNTF